MTMCATAFTLHLSSNGKVGLGDGEMLKGRGEKQKGDGCKQGGRGPPLENACKPAVFCRGNVQLNLQELYLASLLHRFTNTKW